MGENYLQVVSVLVVEDDPGDFGLISEYMLLSGLVPDGSNEPLAWAKSLADGISAAQSNKPDVVLLDLSLPDSTGLNTVRAMRAALPDMPIVVLTGRDDNALDAAALEEGVQDYLVKGQFEHNALGHAVRHALMRTALKRELEHKRAAQHLRELAAHLETVREEEKIRFARELHDDLGGTLAAMRLETYMLAEELSASENTAPLLKYTELQGKLVDDATEAMRRIINNLRPAMLDELGLMAALECHIAQFNKSTSIKCKLDYMLEKDDEKNMSVMQSTHLFRILQEALTNVQKHSRATKVAVEVHGDGGNTTMLISDNGCGVPDNHVASPGSYGLLGMNERVAQLGGKLSFGKTNGGGFSLTIKLPLLAPPPRERLVMSSTPPENLR